MSRLFDGLVRLDRGRPRPAGMGGISIPVPAAPGRRAWRNGGSLIILVGMAAIAMAVYVRPPAGNLAAAVPPAAPIVRSLPAIEAAPDAASGAARQQALELAWRGELGEAERLFRQVVAGDRGDVEAWHGLGVVLIRRGELGPGLDALRTALRLRPSHAEAHRNLGAALDRLGRRDEAIPHYRAFLALTDEGRPGRDDVRRRLGELGAAGGPA